MELILKLLVVIIITITKTVQAEDSTCDCSQANIDPSLMGNFVTDFGTKVKIPADLLLDQILANAQATLTNLTRVYIPTFKYSNILGSVTVRNSYFEGLHSFHRVGPIVMDIHPLGKNQLEFGIGWTQVIAVFNIELYPFQFGMSIIPDKGTLTLSLTNVTSIQAVSIDPLRMNLALEKFDLSLSSATVAFEGFSPTASLGAKMLTAFINQNKDQFLGVVSLVLRTLFNACILGVKALVLP